MNKWIKTKNQTPKNEERVLVAFNSTNEIEIATFISEDCCSKPYFYADNEMFYKESEIYAWQPLPERPERKLMYKNEE